jgi:TolB-like protein/Tfp pilus assembly protein PilF
MRIAILGQLEVRSAAGEPVHLPTRKTAKILAVLALAGAKGMRREVLCAAFWPDRAEAQARGSLRQALAALRRVFPDDDATGPRIDGDLETVHLVGLPAHVDAWEFERIVALPDAASRRAAASLYQGDVLAGATLPESLEDLFAPHRHALRQKALALVERLSESEMPECASAAEALAERLLSADAAAEEAHRALIRLYRRQGRINAARQQYERCKEALRRELGAEPEAKTSALIEDREIAAPAPPPSAAPTAGARERDQPGIIVMPFDNLSGEADDYFVDGVVEEITSALSRVREFFVIARQSAFTYKGRFIDVRELGRDLGVSYVVEGTVRRGGDRLRISVQLIDAATGAQLWSDRFEGATTDIFEFQDRIAAQVAGAIYPAVRKAEIDFARRKSPGSLRAYDLVLQAYPKIWSQNADDNDAAIALLKQAIAADPLYGRAHALLAWCHSQDVVYMWTQTPEESRAAAQAAVDAAAPLIGDDPTALTALGATISQSLDDLDRATSYVERAMALDPNNAWAWSRAGWIAIYRDEPDKALSRFERALALSPLDPLTFNLRIGIAMAYSFNGEYARSVKLLREVLNQHPRLSWAYRQLAFAAAMSGDMPTAREAIRQLRAGMPGISIALMKRAHPSRHTTRVFDLMIKAWRDAGLPEE